MPYLVSNLVSCMMKHLSCIHFTPYDGKNVVTLDRHFPNLMCN